MNRKFKVCAFQITPDENREGFFTKDYVSLGENLVWREAKKLRQQNKGSWIIIQPNEYLQVAQ